jgi:colanic acid/amylovoran biosynthesis glycosyltransferase
VRGTVGPVKGPTYFVTRLRSLISQGCSIQVRLVGAGPDREHLEAFAMQMGIPAVFEGAKSHDETRQLLGRADIFALASFAEGVPVALMEAMAMEVPCVSTSIAGIPELIRDGLDGLLVPASSIEALASAFSRIHSWLRVEDPLLAARHWGCGRQACVHTNANFRLIIETCRRNVHAHWRVCLSATFLQHCAGKDFDLFL